LSAQPARGWTDIARVGLGTMPDLAAVAPRLTETAGGDASAMLGRFEAEGAPPPVPLAVAARQARLAASAPAAAVPASPPPPMSTPLVNEEAPERRSPTTDRPTSRGAGLRDFLRIKPRPERANLGSED